MANDKQFRTRTKFVATRGVEEYRASIVEWVSGQDNVLELGCEWGMTTKLLADRAHSVIGTDISEKCIAKARSIHPEIHFEVLDAFDILAARALGNEFEKIYIDLSGFSGYRSLLDAIAMLNMYATVLRPQAIIVKSGALKQFASQCVAWKSDDSNSDGGIRRDQHRLIDGIPEGEIRGGK